MRIYRQVFLKTLQGAPGEENSPFTVYSDQPVKEDENRVLAQAHICPSFKEDEKRVFICFEPLKVSQAYLDLEERIKDAERALDKLKEEKEVLTGLLYYSIENDDYKAVIGELLVYYSNQGVKVERVQFIPQMPF